jgi:hypothetical protein
VAGIGQQRHRAADQAIGRLDADEGEIERRSDREGAAEAGRRMAVAEAVMMVMIVTMVVPVPVPMVTMVTMVMRVVVMMMPGMGVVLVAAHGAQVR